MKAPVRLGIIGMGGFAGTHHATVARLEERGEARLVCTCDPQAPAFALQQQQWQLARRSVRVFDDYRAMLEQCHRELDAVVIPTPIQLHAEMHAAAAAFGLPSYLEKPATLDLAELERMIAVDARLPRASLVGFNFIVEKPRLALKQRLLAGEFGAIRGATLTAPHELLRAQRLGRAASDRRAFRRGFLPRQRPRPFRAQPPLLGRTRRAFQLGPARRCARRTLPRPSHRRR